MTFEKRSYHKNTGQYRERQKILQVLLTKCVRSNRIQSENKVEKLNVNKHLFCVKKGEICNIL